MGRERLWTRLEHIHQDDFESLALDIYRYQRESNMIYDEYCRLLKGDEWEAKSMIEIPFLPISFFKSHKIKSGAFEENVIYTSSGTTGSQTSCHYVLEEERYLAYAQKSFEQVYGDLSKICFLALLPGYLQRKGSSLISMAHHFIQQSDFAHSGFFLDNYSALKKAIEEGRKANKKIILLGVSFALWELAKKNMDLSDLTVMETGGMKGRGPEMPKEAFHEILCSSFHVDKIHSEYGMTELLSQAYSKGDGRFKSSPTMKVFIRDYTDPLTVIMEGKTGCINVIDLCNIDSCSFIATQDLGRIHDDGEFSVLGRMDEADIRGCNLLVS